MSQRAIALRGEVRIWRDAPPSSEEAAIDMQLQVRLQHVLDVLLVAMERMVNEVTP